MTTAEVTIESNTITLLQEGKKVALEVLSPPNFKTRVVSLSPPPLAYDLNISGNLRNPIPVIS